MSYVYVALFGPHYSFGYYCKCIIRSIQGTADPLDSIQLRLVRRYSDVSVNELQLFFGLVTLGQRKLILEQVFFYKLLNGLIDCLEVLESIDFKVPKETQPKSLFTGRFQPITYGPQRRQRAGEHGCNLLPVDGSLERVSQTPPGTGIL
ncbi:hypothetical protein J6590_049638 [Homalodisca vitripennis]|nr:hypothetical protein J6590_049638 [Homalodisca vitripennis]